MAFADFYWWWCGNFLLSCFIFYCWMVGGVGRRYPGRAGGSVNDEARAAAAALSCVSCYWGGRNLGAVVALGGCTVPGTRYHT